MENRTAFRPRAWTSPGRALAAACAAAGVVAMAATALAGQQKPASPGFTKFGYTVEDVEPGEPPQGQAGRRAAAAEDFDQFFNKNYGDYVLVGVVHVSDDADKTTVSGRVGGLYNGTYDLSKTRKVYRVYDSTADHRLDVQLDLDDHVVRQRTCKRRFGGRWVCGPWEPVSVWL